MSSLIKFTPVSGALDEQPLCYILQIDQATILLDCGLLSSQSFAALEPLRRLQIDAILLSHADLEHLGGLVYAIKHLLITHNTSQPSVSNPPPIYCTLPVANLGRLTAMDHWESTRLHFELPEYDKSDIDAVFDSIKPVKYSESIILSGRCQGITLLPVAAGHTIGGTVWRVKKDTDEIVYAVCYNHKKERHLDGTTLDGIYRPSLLITDCYNAMVTQPTRKQRDADLIDSILKTMQRDGSVLIPIDATTRILELAYLLDQLWAYHQLNFPLIFLAPFAQKTIDYAKSMLEWMGEAVTKVFATSRETPFDFKFLKLAHSVREIEAMSSGPKVILTTLATVENGFAKDLFYSFSDKPQNLIILPTKSFPGTLGRYLYEIAEGKAERPARLALTMRKRIPLEGEELAVYLKERKEAEEEREAEMALQKGLMEEDAESDEDEMDMMTGHGHNLFYGERFDYFCSARQEASSRMNFFANDLRVAMFPFAERPVRLDDYGVQIDLGMFERLELEQRSRYESTAAQPMDVDANAQQQQQQQQSILDIPSKYVSFDVQLEFRIRTKYIDFEGLSDEKSIKTILQHIAPKKLILVHGSEESTNSLKQFLEDNVVAINEIFSPSLGETINVSAATNLYQVKLTDSLVSSLKFSKINDYEIAYLSGKISASSSEETLLLDQLPPEDQWKYHPSVIVGDLKLTELKRALMAKGIVADFEKGSLVIGQDRSIRVQKTREGDLMVEGPFSKDFYKIRKLVYRMHALC